MRHLIKLRTQTNYALRNDAEFRNSKQQKVEKDFPIWHGGVPVGMTSGLFVPESCPNPRIEYRLKMRAARLGVQSVVSGTRNTHDSAPLSYYFRI